MGGGNSFPNELYLGTHPRLGQLRGVVRAAAEAPCIYFFLSLVPVFSYFLLVSYQVLIWRRLANKRKVRMMSVTEARIIKTFVVGFWGSNNALQ